MIISEHFMTREDGVVLKRTYSDAGLMLRQVETGIEYGEAVDVLPCQYTYEETDKSIELSDGEALFILTGGAYGKAGVETIAEGF